MNKKARKRLAKKVLRFMFFRAVEITILSFLAMFIMSRFDGWHEWALLGVSVFMYLFYLIGTQVDDYRARHRYDDVKV
ncbi:MAG: hypothetical protein ABH856_02840 [Patescibacteria group bacterium]